MGTSLFVNTVFVGFGVAFDIVKVVSFTDSALVDVLVAVVGGLKAELFDCKLVFIFPVTADLSAILDTTFDLVLVPVFVDGRTLGVSLLEVVTIDVVDFPTITVVTIGFEVLVNVDVVAVTFIVILL